MGDFDPTRIYGAYTVVKGGVTQQVVDAMVEEAYSVVPEEYRSSVHLRLYPNGGAGEFTLWWVYQLKGREKLAYITK